MLGLHMRDMLGYDDDGAVEDGVNDIVVTRMAPNSTNNDYQLGGSKHLHKALHALIAEFHDIISYSVKGTARDVPPMDFTVDRAQWATNLNRAPSRHISTGKHDALNTMVDSLLELGVIQPSKATACSQVHLVHKPNNGGWRFTTDYRSLHTVISNEGWKTPNMQEMLTRVGSNKTRRLADLTQDCIHEWPQMLCMTENLPNNSIKQPLGVSPNTILYGDAI